MPMKFPPAVEQHRATVAKYFPPELVDKALYVIQHESGGNPGAVGDGGAARGLFQIQDKRNFSNRPDAAYLDNAENNIKYAAQQLGAARGDFSAWGEGTENMAPYDPKTGKGKFGALGNNPFPGGARTLEYVDGRDNSKRTTLPGDPNAPDWQRNPLNGRAPLADGVEMTTPTSNPLGDYTRQRQMLVDALERALQVTRQTPDDQNAILNLNYAIKNLSEFDSAKGNQALLKDNKAQTAFNNAVSLGDFKLRYAAAGYNRYLDKSKMARDAAAAELSDMQARNEAAQAGPSMGERFDLEKKTGVLAGGYTIPPSFEDVHAKWKEKFGVGDEPDMPDDPDIAIPSFSSDEEPGGYSGGDQYDDTVETNVEFRPGNPWNDRSVQPEKKESRNGLATPYGTIGFGSKGPFWDTPLFQFEPLSPGMGGETFSNGERYAFQNAWKNRPSVGDMGGTAGDVANAIRGGVGGLVGGAKKQAGSVDNWWNAIKKPDKWKFGIPHLAGGTDNHRGGPAMLNDGAGPETIIGPDGKPFTLPGGPQVADLPAGSAVLPAGIDPNEAMSYMQIRQAAQQPDEAEDPIQRAVRDADPNAEQATKQALYKAMVNFLAMNAPQTPTYTGSGPDPWAHNRVLSGIPADPAQAEELAAAAAKGKR